VIILHAGIHDGHFFLWGETPAVERVGTSRHRKKKTVPTPFPFDAGAGALADALYESRPDLPRPKNAAGTLTLWLPAVKGQPISSSPLIAPPPENSAAPILAPFAVTALELVPRRAVDLLGNCLDHTTLCPGVVVGATLTYWATALRFAGALVAREQFLPHMEQIGESWFARWKPALVGADADRLNHLARAMPAACRAMTESADAPPARPASVVLTDFLGLAVDALVREALPHAAAGYKESVHDEWLNALRSSVAAVRDAGSPRLLEQVRTWLRPVAVTAETPFRLCFRLDEPHTNGQGEAVAAPKAPWHIHYFLQGRDDPSLLLPVVQAWSPKKGQTALLRRSAFHPREYLLAALGQAAGLSPDIEASLKNATPAGYTTDAGGAHRFLTETSWALEQMGFGVLLPAWWTRKGTKQKLTVGAHVRPQKMTGQGRLTLETVVEFDWQVALGEHTLTRQELETLAKLKAPLVRVRGQWVQVSAEEIQAALAFWKAKESKGTLRDAVQMALGAKPAPGGLEVRNVQGDGWVAEFLQHLQGNTTFSELPPPDGFHGTLRPYQVRGYSWLAFLRQWGLGGCLADDMGLGKNVQTLALFQRDWQAAKKPSLLICPVSVVGNWRKEAERFTPDLPVLVHHGLKRAKGESFAKAVSPYALVVSSYGLMHRDLEQLQKVEWAGVILDEAQNVKNPETKQSKAARSLSAEYRLALTGTPVENHVGDLWSIGEFLNPGFLGSQTDFRRKFYLPIQVQRDSAAAERLKKLTGPFLLRRLKTDKSIIADLPDKLEMKVYCTLTKEQASLYAAVVEDVQNTLNDAEGIQRKGLILATLAKLKQVCNHPAHFLGDNSAIPGRSGKLARLTEMLEEVLAENDRALIFTQFTEMGDLIQRHLQETFGQEVLFLHGGVSQKQRDQMVARFQGEDGPRLFLLSLKAGGSGLNLTAANHVFHYDRWWNPAVENQATDRAFRIGQTRNVQVHKFLCAGTLEEKIDEMIESKNVVAEQVVGTGEGWLTEFSNEQLRDLFALRAEAIGE
jgi:SNF2 family DNA or RNA helicase